MCRNSMSSVKLCVFKTRNSRFYVPFSVFFIEVLVKLSEKKILFARSFYPFLKVTRSTQSRILTTLHLEEKKVRAKNSKSEMKKIYWIQRGFEV